MISDKDIEHLAALARIEMAEEEKNVIRRDLDAILTYVAELSEAVPEKTDSLGLRQDGNRNVLREDVSTGIIILRSSGLNEGCSFPSDYCSSQEVACGW